MDTSAIADSLVGVNIDRIRGFNLYYLGCGVRVFIEKFPGHKGNIIALAKIRKNNNIFVIVSIKSNGNMWNIHSEKCFKTHVDNYHDINLVLLLTDRNAFETI